MKLIADSLMDVCLFLITNLYKDCTIEGNIMCVVSVFTHIGSDHILISLNSSSSGTYIDKKCPFVGDVSIRGRILAGTCHSAKMMRTIIVRRNYLHWVKKYQRYDEPLRKTQDQYSCGFLRFSLFDTLGTRKGIQISRLTYPPASV